jgi:hypothetical protein
MRYGKEAAMGSAKDMKEGTDFCDRVYTELSGMKEKIAVLRNDAQKSGDDKKIKAGYERHLGELFDEIEWKLQILAHSCSYGWKGSDEFDHDVQISADERSREDDFSPGYVGG